MNIRQAQAKDRFALIALLAELGYGGTEKIIETRLAQFCQHPDAELLVAELGNHVLGFLSMYFIPQLALESECARISYFCLAEGGRSQGAETLLLAHAEQLAQQRGCHRIEVHSVTGRQKVSQFYHHKGYLPLPHCHIKDLFSAG